MSESREARTYRFGDHELDVAKLELRKRSGAPVDAEPQVIDVLRYLIEHRDRLVTKNELLDTIWGDRFVSESTLASRVSAARRAVGDDGRAQRIIATVHGRGYRFVAELDGEPDPSDRTPAAPTPAPAGPQKPTIGRERERSAIAGAVAPGALVTLVGPAGVGKTQLARQAMADLVAAFPAGAHLVRLANVRHGDAVAQSMLDALGIPRAPDRGAADTLIGALRTHEGLLVLDNCEHVLAEAAAIVDRVRSAGGTVAVLATSRQRLAVAGEQLIAVDVLDLDAAVDLFAARAEAAGVAAPAGSPSVRALCRRLDRLPLALELAGANLRALGIEQLEALLDERLDLLQGGGEVDHHHRTLEQAIRSSYDALDPATATTAARLSVFAGSFDLDAAVDVACADTSLSRGVAVRHIIDLAERSLLALDGGAEARSYRLLESVRLFLEQQLDDPAPAELAHLEHYARRAVDLGSRLSRADFVAAFGETPPLWDNLRAAVGYGLRHGRLERTAELLRGTIDYAEVTQRLEHGDWARRVLAQEPEGPLFDDVRVGLARLQALEDLARTAELVAGIDPDHSLATLTVQSWLAMLSADVAQVAAITDRLAERFATAEGLPALNAGSMIVSFRLLLGQDPGATLERLRDLADRAGAHGAAYLAGVESQLVAATGDHTEAYRLAEHSIEQADALGLELVAMAGRRSRAQALAGLDDQVTMAGLLRDALAEAVDSGRWLSIMLDAPLIAQVLHDGGRHEAAARVLSVFVDSGLSAGWSDAVAGPLTEALRTDHPELATVLEPAPPTSTTAFATTVQRELEALAGGG